MSASTIPALRQSLGFGAADEALVRAAAPRLVPEVERWVEQFYARLVVDPVAMGILRDESRVLRLKRSLVAWFLEIFSLPLDENYERARRDIGIVHVRIGMPLYLMVTAMGGLRRDVAQSVARLWADDPSWVDRTTVALSKLLDLELALMLEAYRRRQRELEQKQFASLQGEGMASRLVQRFRESIDAALCYVELLRSASGPDRDAWATRLNEVLRSCAADPSAGPGETSASVRMQPQYARELCERAAGNVSLGTTSGVEIEVVPPRLELTADPARLQRALEALVQGMANLQLGNLRLRARAEGGGVGFEVLADGGAWPPGVVGLEDLATEGLDLDLCLHVARLHGGTLELARDAEGRATGVRLSLPNQRDMEAPGRASQRQDPQGTSA
jgi:hypothetical protein